MKKILRIPALYNHMRQYYWVIALLALGAMLPEKAQAQQEYAYIDWSTFYGGDYTFEVAVPFAENRFSTHWVSKEEDGIYFFGVGYSEDNWPRVNSIINAALSVTQCYVYAKLDLDGNIVYSGTIPGRFSFSTYNSDYEMEPIVHNGELYMTVFTTSSSFPTTAGAAQPNTGGSIDLYMLKLDAMGNLAYSTYLGGSGIEESSRAQPVVVNGEVYITGTTDSPDFPTTPGAAQPYLAGERDFFVTKLDASGNLVYSTYVGGSNQEYTYGDLKDYSPYIPVGQDLIVDNGEVYFMGESWSDDYPTTPGAAQEASNGIPGPGFVGRELVVTKLDAAGNLVYSTYLGGSNREMYGGLLGVHNGQVLVGASTQSDDYPVTPGAFQTGKGGGDYDIVLTKLDASGGLVYSTYLGGDGSDHIGAPVASYGQFQFGANRNNDNYKSYVFKDGELYLSGYTTSSNFPTTSNLPGNMFVTKFDAAGNLVYSTTMGGESADWSLPLANLQVDASGAAYFSSAYFGGTDHTGFPTTPNAFQTSGSNIYVKLDPQGNIDYATYLGSGIVSIPLGGLASITLGDNGEMYLLGASRLPVIPVTPGAIQSEVLGGNFYGDAFLVKLDASYNVRYATYLGGAGGQTTGNYLSLGDNGEAYWAGSTFAPGFPVTPGAAKSYLGANNTYDFFLTKLQFTDALDFSNVISPATQEVCQFGLPELLDGSSAVMANSNSFPPLLRNGQVEQQFGNLFPVQWQTASSPLGPWTDIPDATLEDFLPTLGVQTAYFRRRIGNGLEGTTSYSNVAEIILNGNPSPTVTDVDPLFTCTGETVVLGAMPTATGGTGVLTYQWDMAPLLDDPTLANPLATVSESSVFSVTVTDENACTQSGQVLVETVGADAGPDASSCGGVGVRIGTEAPDGVTGLTYSWAPATGLSCTDCPQPIASPAVPTTYTLTLTLAIPGGGMCSTSDDVLVTPAFPPAGEFAGLDQVVCISDFVTLGLPAEPGYSYSWSPGIGLSGYNTAQVTYSGNNNNLNLPNPNPITYTLTATIDGCSFQDQVVVTEIEARAGLDLDCGPGVIGEPDRTPNVNETYNWVLVSGTDILTGPSNTAQTTVGTNTSGTPSVYQLEVTYNGVTCTDQVVIDPCGPTIPDCDVAIISNADCPIFDINNPLVLNAIRQNCFGDASDYNFSWSPMVGLNTYTGPQVQLLDDVERTYTVTMTSTLFPSVMATASVTVNSSFAAPPVFSAQGGSVCAGAISIGESPANPDYTYRWTGPNGFFSTDSNPSVTDPGSYFVTVTDGVSGCRTEDVAVVRNIGPTANAGDDWRICDAGQALVQLGTPDPSGGQWQYQWSPNVTWQNGTTANSAQPQFFASTDLTFTVTVTDPVTGCTSTDMVSVISEPEGTFSAPTFSNEFVCLGNSVTIGPEDSPPGLTYSWSPTTDLSCTDCAQPSVTPTAGGDVTYTLTVAYPGCSTPTSTSRYVRTLDPSFDLGPDTTYCPGDGPISIGDNAPPSGNPYTLTYIWSPPTGLSSPTVRNPTANPTVPTTYTLQISEVGCIATDEITVSPINPAPEAGNLQTICVGQSATLGNPSNTGTLSWTSSPAGAVSELSSTTDPNPVFTPTTGGTYTFTLTQDIDGCTNTDVVTITVVDIDFGTFDQFVNVCAGACVEIGPVAQPDVAYSWTPTTGIVSPNSARTTICPTGTSTTTYTLTATSLLSACTATTEVQVIPSAEQAPTVTIPDLGLCQGDNGVFMPSVSPAGTYDYTWGPTANLSNPYIANPTVGGLSIGTTTYNLTVTDPTNNCRTTAQANVNVTSGSGIAADILSASVDCNQSEVSFTTNIGGVYSSLQWTTGGDGTFVPNANDPNAVYEPGTSDLANQSVTIGLEVIGQDCGNLVSDELVVSLSNCALPPIDLAITKIVDNLMPNYGDNVTFTLEVTNNGPWGASGVVVDDLLPAGFTYVSDNSGGAYSGASGVWTIGNLNVGQSVSIQITAAVDGVGDFLNLARVTSDQPDYFLPNNEASEEVFPIFPPLVVDIICPETTFDLTSITVENQPPGTTVTYHSDQPVSLANQVADPSMVGPGTYYVAFYDAVDMCFSSVTQVTVTLDPYLNNCTPDCVYDPTQVGASDFTIVEKYMSTDNTISYQTPIVGDIDNDGVVEIITMSTNSYGAPRRAKDLLVINGQTGVTEQTIVTPYMYWSNFAATAIADIDNDGTSEIFIATTEFGNTVATRFRLQCYEHTGTLRWTSSANIGLNGVNAVGGTIGIADFNEDGIAEVYIYNQIFNAQTGQLLVQGTAGAGASRTTQGTDANIPAANVAADLTGHPGLELAAGNTVYEVNITNTSGTAGNSMNAIVLPAAFDGYTSVVDIDLDGELDVVVIESSTLSPNPNTVIRAYVWNPRTNSLIAEASVAVPLPGSGLHSGGRAFIGDMDADCQPEIGFTGSSRVFAFDYNGTATLQQKWVLTTSDDSGLTGITLFDFNQDGNNELVYRDQSLLQIYDASGSSPVVLASFPCISGTGDEMAVVADVDSDGAAEMLITCGDVTGAIGNLVVYESGDQPWAPARSVWNQDAYNAVNINDDLSVPQVQRDPQELFSNNGCGQQACTEVRPLNSFLQQATTLDTAGCPLFAAADLTINVVGEPAFISDTTYQLTVEICNLSEQSVLAGVPFRVYTEDPLTNGSAILLTTTVPANPVTTMALAENECDTIIITVGVPVNSTDLVLLVNDDGSKMPVFNFPVTNIPECDYTNNLTTTVLPCIDAPIVSIGSVQCVDGTTYEYTFAASAGATVVSANGTISGNTVTVAVGTNDVLTAYNDDPSCPTVSLSVTSPADCNIMCEQPDLTLGNSVCTDGTTYAVSFTETTGATITASAGTVSGNVVSGIPAGTDVVITATNPSDGACAISLTATSPTDCTVPCPNDLLSVSALGVCAPDAQTYAVNFVLSPGATLTTDFGTIDLVNSMVTGIPAGQSVTLTATNAGCNLEDDIVVAAPDCCIDAPIVSIGSVQCVDGTTYEYSFTASPGATVVSANGTISGNTVTVAVGTNDVLTAYNGDPNCPTVSLSVTSPADCNIMCEQPDLTLGNSVCENGTTYAVSFTETTGATITASVGTVVGNIISGIPVGTDVVITATNPSDGACAISLTATSPTDCTEACPDDLLSVSALGVCAPDAQTYAVNFVLSPGATLTTDFGTIDLVNSMVTGIPAGQSVTLTATNAGCNLVDDITVPAPDCCIDAPIVSIGSVQCVDGTTYEYSFTASPGATVVSANGTITGNTVTVAVGTNDVLTAYNGDPSCPSLSLSVTSPADCNIMCEQPDLTLGNSVCENGTTYAVSFTETTGTTITASAGTITGNVVSGIPVGTDVVITATNASDAACTISLTAISPVDCTTPCPDDLLSVSALGECAADGLTYSVNFVLSAGATLSADFGTIDLVNSMVTGIPAGQSVTLTATNAGCNLVDDIVVAAPDCCIDAPIVSIGSVQCVDGTTYEYSFTASPGATVVSANGTISGNTVTVAVGTNDVLTAYNGDPSCPSVSLNVTSPVSCNIMCEQPDLTLGNSVCENGLTYSVSFTETTGATITASVGTVVGNIISGIPVGTDVVITATNPSDGACAISLTATSPTDCTEACPDDLLSVSALGVCAPDAQTYAVNFVLSPGATLTTDFGTIDLVNSMVTGIPAGQSVTLTATNAGCNLEDDIVVAAPDCCIDAPIVSIGSVQCVDGTTYEYSFTASPGATVVSANGTISGNTVTVAVGTNDVLTAYNDDPSCPSLSLSVTSPVTCNIMCEQPDLTLGNSVCENGTTYAVSFTETTGATITASAGTITGNVVSGIPVGTDVVITATNASDAACTISLTATSPTDCTEACPDDLLSVSALGECALDAQTYAVNFVLSPGATLTTDFGTIDLVNSMVTGIPAGQSVTLTATNAGCNLVDDIVVAAPVCLPPFVKLNVKVRLQGPLLGNETGLMRDDLRAQDLIPAIEPYTGMTNFMYIGTGGGETVLDPVTVFADLGSNSIVDWVFVELRSAANPAMVVDTRAGLLQRDGDVVDVDGVSSLCFTQSTNADYYVAIRHRNHLGTMTANPLPLTSEGTVVDFTDTGLELWNNQANFNNREQVTIAGQYALWAGNTTSDDRVVYAGQVNDRDPIFNAVDGAAGNFFKIQTYILPGYNNNDVDLDGDTIYAGQGNDVDPIFNNVDGHLANIFKIQTFIILEQLAE